MDIDTTGPLGIPITRGASGTAWQPDSTPMHALHGMAGGWTLMLHGNVFVGYDSQSSDRGTGRFISTNWLMFMAEHNLGPGAFGARVMLSAEPLTVGGRGYPLLLQTGETWNDAPLHDRQHPHDFFMELALLYTLPVSANVGVQLYVAPAGEPALGPVAFPHRASAMSDPLAPIGHHWQDSTHISYGVLTAGVFMHQVKLEGSWFNGREPDEDRWDVDLRAPDSYSGRLSFNPDENWSLQGSYGYLSSPEPSEPSLSLHRVTASTTYNRHSGAETNWATTFVVGGNIEQGGSVTPAFLLETNWNLDGHHDLFGRAEYARKTGRDLVLPEQLEPSRFDMATLALGYVYYFGHVASFMPGIGARGSINWLDSSLENSYGTRFPMGGMVFAQVLPTAMSM
ncbi:MAG TPA: hypothetical protein VG937_00305 [Polyangiaceae bacterium]|nr:hypothetical protein [Polyangiaceae bacterium]